jgi:hypothetical protein
MGVMTLFQMILLIDGQLKARVSFSPRVPSRRDTVHCTVSNLVNLVRLEA